MKQTADVLLKKLARSRPKPSEKDFKELFMFIKAASLDELMALCRTTAPKKKTTRKASPLEKSIKKQLREAGGKATDLMPFLAQAIDKRLAPDQSRSITSKMALTRAIGIVEKQFGSDAEKIAQEAIHTMISEYDISYQLKAS